MNIDDLWRDIEELELEIDATIVPGYQKARDGWFRDHMLQTLFTRVDSMDGETNYYPDDTITEDSVSDMLSSFEFPSEYEWSKNNGGIGEYDKLTEMYAIAEEYDCDREACSVLIDNFRDKYGIKLNII